MKKIFLSILFSLITFNAYALSIIIDEETESWLEDVLSPIMKEANIPISRDKIHIVKDSSLNAFVGDANHMFIHTGTLLKASNTNEIEGVLAHETGHILGGHILRLKIQMKSIEKASLASLIAAAGAAAVSGRGDAAIAVVLGTQSSAINAITAYQITEERAADETAINLLSKQNKSITGLKNFMEKIKTTNRLEGVSENTYFRTHPLTQERISFFNEKITNQKSTTTPNLDKRLERIQAKLYAYLSELPQVLKKYPLNQTSTEATIAHAVYYMRQRNLNSSLKYIEKLLSQEPENPYFWELKAQALLEASNPKEASLAYSQALKLKPNSDIYKINYAETLLATEPSRKDKLSLIPMLEHANRNSNNPEAYHLLGRIHNDIGQFGISNYYLAEYYHLIGNDNFAQKMLTKALKTPLREDIQLRAEDLKQKLSQKIKKDTIL